MRRPHIDRFLQYLSVKKAIDDRSLNEFVWKRLERALARMQKEKTIKVLEVGCGIGTMIERLLARNLLRNACYTGIDREPSCIREAHRRLPAFGAERNMEVTQGPEGSIVFRDRKQVVTLTLEKADIFHYAKHPMNQGGVDLLVAHAFLDLVDLDSTLPHLLSLVRPGGLIYSSLNFDGLTVFEPAIDRTLDEEILKLYHQTMDNRSVNGKPSGTSRTGRLLPLALRDQGVEMLGAGSSDWVCLPGKDGYDKEEAFFLHFIVDTVKDVLAGHPDLDRLAFSRWVKKRHDQIDGAELIYIAHQLDILGRRMPRT
jgi:SAM-dependent methyltransferase